jgi:Zn finger protein HypA/HybF involved in hydrogenase expression
MISIKKENVKKRAKRSPIWKMPFDDFCNLVNKSESIGQILKVFGLENKGRNSETVKRRCEEENIDMNHIKLGINSNKGRKFIVSKTPIEEILQENSTFSRMHLKERLVKENILEYKCECCGNRGEWLNKPLSLHLEHKNGISNDHRLENICFLCPNCHSQTDTYAGKKRH